MARGRLPTVWNAPNLHERVERMSASLPVRARRAAAAILAAAVVAGLAGCTGDDEDQDSAESAAEIIRDLPDAAAVESAVADAIDTTTLPEDVVPGPGLVARSGSLDSLEQRCARDYLYADIDEICVFGDPKSKRTILLWGDSRAAMWMPALSRIAEQNGYALAVVTKLGCPPLLGPTPWLAAESRPYVECVQFNDRVTELVNDVIKPRIVVLSGAVRGFAASDDGKVEPLGEGNADNTWTPDHDADEIWQTGLRRALESFDDDDAEVFVLGEAPYPTQDAGTCLAEHPDAVDECGVTPEIGVYDEHNAAERATAEDAGATYVSALPWLCDDDLCPAVIDDHVVYRDSFHLNREFVLHISRALGSALGLDDWKALRK